jgi:threonine dehydratase
VIRIDAAMVETARAAIADLLEPTSLVPFATADGRAVHLKLESEQPTGSFKVRGALHNLVRRPASANGFVTASAGNHGLGVAWAAQRTGRTERITIFVPTSTPERKVSKLRAFGMDLRIEGATFDDAERSAREFEARTGAVYIHAYDDPLTAAGQGTVALEIAEQLEGPPGTIVIPVGGGGLITGSAAWLKERRPSVRVVAVQPDASPALSESIRLRRALLEYDARPTLADGLSGGIGRLVFEHRDLIDETINVPEERIRAAIRTLHERHEIRAEASGAITVAALESEHSRAWPAPIVCVITGSNIDDAALRSLLG